MKRKLPSLRIWHMLYQKIGFDVNLHTSSNIKRNPDKIPKEFVVI